MSRHLRNQLQLQPWTGRNPISPQIQVVA